MLQDKSKVHFGVARSVGFVICEDSVRKEICRKRLVEIRTIYEKLMCENRISRF